MISSNAHGSTLRRLMGVVVVAVTAVALMPATAPAQSGGDLLQEALERFEERAEGIDNYTVVQEVMGTEMRERYVKQQVEGHTVFVAEGADESAQQMNMYRVFPKLMERAEVRGSETVNGTPTRLVVVEDLEGLGMMDELPTGSDGAGDYRPERLSLYLGTEDYLIHRMEMVGTVQNEGGSQEVTFTADLRDYREVEGFYHPWRVEARLEGLMATLDPQQRQKLQQLQEQLESMPPAQREQMKKMLGPQIEALSGGGMDFTLTVKDFQVNTPSPGGSGS